MSLEFPYRFTCPFLDPHSVYMQRRRWLPHCSTSSLKIMIQWNPLFRKPPNENTLINSRAAKFPALAGDLPFSCWFSNALPLPTCGANTPAIAWANKLHCRDMLALRVYSTCIPHTSACESWTLRNYNVWFYYRDIISLMTVSPS